jgi:hypothetical protein
LLQITGAVLFIVALTYAVLWALPNGENYEAIIALLGLLVSLVFFLGNHLIKTSAGGRKGFPASTRPAGGSVHDYLEYLENYARRENDTFVDLRLEIESRSKFDT